MKKVIIAIAVILVICMGGGAWYYYNNISVDSSSIKKIEIPDVNNITVPQNGVSNGSTQSLNVNTGSGSAGQSGSSTASQTSGGTATGKQGKEQTITAKYTAGFSILKNESLSSLNSLIKQAKSEYNSLPDSEKAASRVSLAMKYIKLGKALEKECDTAFDTLLGRMKKELKSNGLPTDAADAAQKEYSKEKSERRSYLMGKVF